MALGFADGGTWLAGLVRRNANPAPETSEDTGAGHNQPALPFGSTGPHGHRQRMRERLLGAGPASLADYELLEMLLFLGIPRRDTKPFAKALINHFGSLAAVLSAPVEALLQAGLNESCAALIRLPEQAAVYLAGPELLDRPVLNNWDRLVDYFETALTGAIPGQLRILFLDNRNRLLADEVAEEMPSGQPRPIMRRALDLHSTALIVVRVVPPGPVARSMLAREAALGSSLARAAAPLAIILHDHMLVGGGNWVSLRQKGML